MHNETGNNRDLNIKLRAEIRSLSNNLLAQSVALSIFFAFSLFMAFKNSPAWVIVCILLLFDLAEAVGKYINIYKEMRVLKEIKKILENVPWAQVKGREGEIEQALNFINYRIDNGQSSQDALDRFRKDIDSIINNHE